LIIAGAGLASAIAIKPRDEGEGYSDYFRGLNDELKANGPFKPSMLVDLDRLDRNIQALKATLVENYRIVVKSLPSPGLLSYIMEKAGTNRLMVFHQPFVSHMAETFPQSDMLIGKPLPVRSAKIFYERFSGASGFEPSVQLQWLIDTNERLDEYQTLAAKLGTKMRINVEIDVGLHRGGLQNPTDLIPLVDQILADPEHLEFAGLMGYDPHVVKVPRIIKSPQKAYEQSQFLYQGFRDILKDKYPRIDHSTLCLNGAGSPTLNLHKQGTVANDISAGSCLVKPTDFDVPTLEEFMPAAFIATPVLKKLDGTNLPSAEALKGIFSLWDPNRQQTYFIYGGKWMANYESPAGLRDNSLYGYSTNQQMVTGSFRTALEVNDHIFLRPHQSEFVFLQFGDLLAIRDGKVVDHWPILKQSA